MKSALLTLFLLAAGGVLAENTDWQLPAQKAGTGSHDFYNLGARLGDESAEYYLAIAAHKKFDLTDVRVSAGGHRLEVAHTEVIKRFLSKSELVRVSLGRELMEIGAQDGLKIEVTSGREPYRFDVPADQFATMLREADVHDDHRRKKLAEQKMVKLGQLYDSEVAEAYLLAGTASINGQAFLKTRGGDVKLGAGNAVMMTPDDEWTQAIWAIIETGG